MEELGDLFLLLIFFCFLLLYPGRPQCVVGCYAIRAQFMSLKGPEAGVSLGLGQRLASLLDPIALGSRGTTGSKARSV